jgi:iron complex outermembrane receptor protein
MPADNNPRLMMRAALATAIAAAIVAAPPETASAQNGPDAIATAAPSPDIRPAQPLPPMTVYSRKHKHARASKRKPVRAAEAPRASPLPAATRSLPDGVVLRGGPGVTQTTAGPVSGYRALTSTSATKTDAPVERIPQAIAVIPRSMRTSESEH